MAAAEPFQVFKRIFVNVGKFSCTVFGEGSVLYGCFSIVAPQAWKHLVYYGFLHVCSNVSVNQMQR